MYACGETTNGRLGLGTNVSSPIPRQLTTLNRFIVRKVAVHSGGKHAMALTLSGKVSLVFKIYLVFATKIVHYC